MAKENIQIQIDAAVKSAEAAKSLGELKKSLIELNTLQAQLGADSGPQFDQLASAASKASSQLAETRDKIGDIQDKTRTLEGTPIERLSGSFGLLKESIMNLDFDKAKIGLEGLTNAFTPVVDGKLVSGFAGIKGAMSGLMDGVKNLGSTFMSVGKALLTNPIFLLATAITLIVIGIIKLLDSLGLLKPMLDAIKAAIGFVIDMFEALTDWLGLTTHAQEENAAAAKANGETQRAEIDATAKKQQQHLKDIENMTDAEIAEYKKKAGIKDNLNKSSFDIEKDRLEQTQETLKAEIDALNELEAAGGELTDEQKKDLEQRKKDYQANADAIVAVEEQKQKAIIDFNKKTTETLEGWKIKNIKDENERRKAELQLSEAAELRKIDVEIANGNRLNQDVSKLKQARLEIVKYFDNEEAKINEAINKKQADIAKTASDNKTKQVIKDLKALEDAEEKKVLATEKNTQKRIDAETAAENAIFEFRKKNAKRLELTDVQLDNIRKRLDESQKERQEAFDKGQIESYNKNLLLADQNAIDRAKTDDELYAAKRKLIEDQAKIEQQAAKDNAVELERITIDAANKISALDAEFNQKKVEDAAITSQLLVDRTNFEIEQYERKINDFGLLDAKQIDNLIKLDMQEQIALQDQMALELADTELTEAQKNEIKERYRQLNIEQEQNAQERLRQAKLKAVQDDIDMAQRGLSAVTALSNALFENKRSNLKKGSAEEQKAAEQQFNVNKALQLGLAVIDGFKAVTSSLSQSPVAIGPVPNPAGIASLAFAIATSAANIIKIASTKFEKSPAPTTPSASSPASPGAAGGGEGGMPPTLSPNQFFGLGQTTAMGENGNQPIKVYVTEGDITGVQERVAVIEERAILR